MKTFRTDNTEDYAQDELDSLNAEWLDRVEEMGLEECTEEYDQEAKAFSDMVAGR